MLYSFHENFVLPLSHDEVLAAGAASAGRMGVLLAEVIGRF